MIKEFVEELWFCLSQMVPFIESEQTKLLLLLEDMEELTNLVLVLILVPEMEVVSSPELVSL
jgi:hypothetical protein